MTQFTAPRTLKNGTLYWSTLHGSDDKKIAEFLDVNYRHELRMKHPVYIMVSRMVTYATIYLQILRLNIEAYMKFLNWTGRSPTFETRTLRPYTQIIEPNIGCEKISSTSFYPNIYPSTSLHCDPLDYYVRGAVEGETNKTLYNTKDYLKAKIMATFTNLNQENIGKGCRKCWSRLAPVMEANSDFFK